MARTPRPAVVLLAGVATLALLVAGCGGDDGDDAGDGAKGSTTTTSAAALTDSPCSILDPADLSAVMGVEFDTSTPSTNQCVYTSSKGLTAVAISLRSVDDPTTRLAKDKGSCAEGTAEDQDFDGAVGGFSCVIAEVPTVVAIGGDGIEVILTSGALGEGADPKPVEAKLVTVLQRAIAAGGPEG